MMRVLVTGASGGLGRMVIEQLLAKNIKVVACSRSREKAEAMPFFKQIDYVQYDLNDPSEENLFEKFGRPDALVHLAWEKLDDYRNEAHLSAILKNHKTFVQNLVKNGLKSLTGIGSCYEYGIREGVLSEDMPSAPVLPYPQAKDLLRQFSEDLCKIHGCSFKWVRIFYVFGYVEGRKNLYNHLLKAIENKDDTFNMSGGQQIRDFLSPAEVSAIIVKASLQDKVTGIINCCSGKPVKLEDFVNDFLQKHNYKIKLNLGFYPYPDYEPMNTWGSVEKLNKLS